MSAVSFRPAAFEEEPQVPQLAYSDQQQAAIDFIRFGRGNGIITSVAGSGKTTTLMAMLPYMGDSYVSLVCYSKPIQLEIEEKTRARGFGPKIRTGTFHSFGRGAWYRVAPNMKLDGMGEGNAGYWKYDRIFDIMDGVEQLPDAPPGQPSPFSPIPYEYRAFVRKLCSLAKQYALGTQGYPLDSHKEWEYLVDHFDLDEMLAKEGCDGDINISGMVEKGIAFAKTALAISIKLAREVIDFDDMVYMPLFTECRMFQVDYLLVDEAQDLNRSRRMLARKMLNPYRGRAIFVGDERQAIMGFSGADAESFQQIAQEFKCKPIQLTVSFRCPKKVVELARTWVDHIEAKPNAEDGEVKRVSSAEFIKTDFLETDAILCRNNAPLVSLAYALIRKGVACYIEGRDVGTAILELAGKWRVVHLSALVTKAKAYREREIAKLIAKGHDAQAEMVADKVDTLLALIEGMPKEATLSDLQQRIKTMFQDASGVRKRMLVLSSVHKAKGKEWPRVFLLGRNAYMPSKYARQEWHKIQEANLQYVAVTRALKTFVDVDVPSKKLDFKELGKQDANT